IAAPPFPAEKAGGGLFHPPPGTSGHFVRKYQLARKSIAAYFTPCRRSTSQPPRAGSPKGETRDASTNMAMQPTVCPASRQRIARKDRPTQATMHTAPATQDRNVTTATMRIRARTKGAAMIFKIVRIVHTSYKKFVVCLYMYIITPQEGANKDAS